MKKYVQHSTGTGSIVYDHPLTYIYINFLVSDKKEKNKFCFYILFSLL
jgi:hypothetical protein